MTGLAAASDDQVIVRHETVTEGRGCGTRTITVQAAGGLTTRILLDRGMDLGATWFAGQPVSWRSAVGECRPGRVDGGTGWLDQWEGGLLTTCGLRNVGSPSEGHGQHGSYTELAARDICVTRRWLEDGETEVEISGVMDDASSLGSYLQLHRIIRLRTGSGYVDVVDRTVNLGPEPEQAPILYHVNFGFPFLTPESRFRFDPVRSARGDGTPVPVEEWASMGAPGALDDRIVEHELGAGHEASVELTSPHLGLVAHVAWDRSTMPRLHTWQRVRAGSFVASIEPSNAGLGGRTDDRAGGREPMLEPGAERVTSLEVSLSPATGPRT